MELVDSWHIKKNETEAPVSALDITPDEEQKSLYLNWHPCEQDPYPCSQFELIVKEARGNEEQIVAWVETVPDSTHNEGSQDRYNLDSPIVFLNQSEIDIVLEPLVDWYVPSIKEVLDFVRELNVPDSHCGNAIKARTLYS